ncbi:MAG TPA: hypothetical protein VGL81_33085 [Polyangiaceae bacterium]|jgi:hypothetical protein
MPDEPVPALPKTPLRRYFAAPVLGLACVAVVALVAWLRGCPPDPPRPGTVMEEAGVDLPASVPVEFGGRKGVLVGGKVVLEPRRGDGGGRDE